MLVQASDPTGYSLTPRAPLTQQHQLRMQSQLPVLQVRASVLTVETLPPCCLLMMPYCQYHAVFTEACKRISALSSFLVLPSRQLHDTV